MDVCGIIKSSLIDYPGLVSCVLFVQGCNYNCFYCHNRSLIDSTHSSLNPDYLQDFLTKRTHLLDGVVISGGEPTLRNDLMAYAEKIKRLGYQLKLDTNGSSPGIVEQLLRRGLFDYYAVDYKAPAARYQEICGPAADAEAVQKTIGLLLKSGVDFEVRTTVIPQFSSADLITMAQELPLLKRYVLNRYRKPEKFLLCDRLKVEQIPYTQSQINGFANLIRPWQPGASA